MNVISNNKLKSTIALAALQNVMDPEIGLNIVDLGLVYQIDFDESESITNAAKESLKLGFSEYEPNIKLTFDPPWNHEMISEAGQDFLNEM